MMSAKENNKKSPTLSLKRTLMEHAQLRQRSRQTQTLPTTPPPPETFFHYTSMSPSLHKDSNQESHTDDEHEEGRSSILMPRDGDNEESEAIGMGEKIYTMMRKDILKCYKPKEKKGYSHRYEEVKMDEGWYVGSSQPFPRRVAH